MRCLVLVLALVACSKSEPQPAPVETKLSAEPAILDTLSLEDLVGYASGAYHAGGNNPAIYADIDHKTIVLMGNKATAKIPIATQPAEAAAAYEAFLVQHGYEANGKQPTDEHQHVMINGKEMVVMSTDELLPAMPADLKAHFTPAQYDLLYHTPVAANLARVALKVPVMYCYSNMIAVIGPAHPLKEYPIEQASKAFAEFQTMLPKG
ncbi:MAG TPA: hypothetical protein VGM90_41515 [Kofleriaceae bacterium]|jgi:hypothetical protein